MVQASLGRLPLRLKRILFHNLNLNWHYLILVILPPVAVLKGLLATYAFVVCINIVDEVFPKMPIVTVTDDISERIPLVTAPPDGYVVVRRMNYGEELKRSGMAAKLLMNSDKNSKDFQGEIDMQTEEVAYWDFANLVVEHNMQDQDGRTLNFKNRADVVKLSGPVGKEIGQVIDDFNNVKDSEETKNS
jgi:hypothetical protein